MHSLILNNRPQRKAALAAAWSLIGMALIAGFAFGYAFNSVIIPGNATETALRIRADEGLFGSGVAGFVVIGLLDIVSAVALYAFFRANRQLSLLTAGLRLAYAVVLGIALLHFLPVLNLLNSHTPTADLQAMEHITAFFDTWSAGLIVFGAHLILLGYLAFKSGFVPKAWGILLIVAGACYLFSHTADLLLPGYEQYKAVVDSILSLPMIVGELGFAFWLLFRGGKPQRSIRRVAD